MDIQSKTRVIWAPHSTGQLILPIFADLEKIVDSTVGVAYYSLYIILYSEIQTNLSYGHPLIPRHPDKR